MTSPPNASPDLSSHDPLLDGLRLYIERAPTVIALFDREMRYLAASRAWCETYGIDDVIGSRHYDVVPDLPTRYLDAHQRGLRGEVVEQDADSWTRADGRIQYLYWRVTPWWSGPGRVGGITIAVEDVTERRRHAEALEAAQARFDLATRAVRGHVYDYDATTGHVYRSASLLEQTGFAADDVATTPGWWDSIIHPDDRARVVTEGHQRLADGAEAYELTYRIVHRSGAVRWVLDRPRVFRATDGTVARIVGTSVDITALKETEAALRHSERQAAQIRRTFERLVDDNPFGIYVVDEDFRLARVSRGAHKVFENVRPLIGRDFAEVLRAIWPEPAASEFVEQFRSTLATGKAYFAPSTVERRRDVDATEAYDWRIERIELPQGRHGVVCFFYDLTVQQQLTAELRTSELRYRELIEQMPDGLFLADADGRFVDVNPAAARMLGRTREALLARTFVDVLDPSEHPRLDSYFTSLVGGGVNRTEWRFRRPDGSTLIGELVGRRLADGSFQGVVRDVTVRVHAATERARMEGALREAESRFRAMADAAPVLIWETDAHGAIYVNQHYLDFFGTDFSSIAGMGWATFLHPDDVEGYTNAYRLAFTQRVDYVYECRFRRADGEYRWLRNVGRPAGDGRFVGCSVDVTDLQQLQLALKEADQRKDEFLATLSHELRNPLAPIRTAAQILASPMLDEQQHRWARLVIQRQVSHIAWLLDDLFDVARITQGKLTLNKTQVALTGAVDAAVEAARPLLDRKQQRLTVTLPPVEATIDGDPVRITQIVSNLLTNAAKYTDQGGDVDLTATVARGDVMIEVRDTGIGIPAESLGSIFTMFSQVAGTSGRSDGGLGIGLALVKGLVDLHGGSIRADSDGPGRGSTFTVRLPLADAGAVRAAERSDAARRPGSARRVLVVDDNRDAADSLGLLLQLAGHDVRVAHDGVAALAIARTFLPELALLDLGMPEMDGLQLAQALRAEPWSATLRLAALTGWGQDEDRRRTSAAGFDHHLTKPVDLDEIAALVAQLSVRTP